MLSQGVVRNRLSLHTRRDSQRCRASLSRRHSAYAEAMLSALREAYERQVLNRLIISRKTRNYKDTIFMIGEVGVTNKRIQIYLKE